MHSIFMLASVLQICKLVCHYYEVNMNTVTV